jgi:hypothetical protein
MLYVAFRRTNRATWVQVMMGASDVCASPLQIKLPSLSRLMTDKRILLVGYCASNHMNGSPAAWIEADVAGS